MTSEGESQALISNMEDAYGTKEMSSPPQASTPQLPDEDLSFVSSPPKTAFEKFKKRIRYYIPVISWLPHYPKSYFASDLIAGLTTSSLLLPQAISYSALAHLPPSYGLYTSFFPLIVYFFLGTSRQLGVGPDALISILTGQAIAPLVTCNSTTTIDSIHFADSGGESCDEEAELVSLAAVLAFYVGVFTLILGFFRLGFMDSILSRATNRGFITSVAFIIFVEQLPPFLGYTTKYAAGATTVDKIKFLFEYAAEFKVNALLLGLSTLIIVFAHKFLKTKIKHPLIAKFLKFTPVLLLTVILMMIVTWGFALDEGEDGITIIGDVEPGFHTPTVPPFSSETVGDLSVQAFVITICGFIQSIVIAKEFANRNMYSVSDNRELVAFGVQNLFGSFFGAYPNFASPPRTVVNNDAGAKTQISLLITCSIMLVVILYLITWFYYLPKCVASAIVITAAVGLIQIDDIVFHYRLRAWGDLLMMSITFLLTLFLGISVGIFVSLLLSLALVVKEATQPIFITLLGQYRDTNKFRDVDKSIDAHLIPGVLIFQVNTSLFFANTAQLKDRLRRAEVYGSIRTHPSEDFKMSAPLRYVIFDLSRMPNIDASSLQVLIEVVESFNERSIKVLIVRLPPQCKQGFDLSGLTEKIGPNNFLGSLAEAMDITNTTIQ